MFTRIGLTLVFPQEKTSVVSHHGMAWLVQQIGDQSSQNLTCSVFPVPKISFVLISSKLQDHLHHLPPKAGVDHRCAPANFGSHYPSSTR